MNFLSIFRFRSATEGKVYRFLKLQNSQYDIYIRWNSFIFSNKKKARGVILGKNILHLEFD